MSSWIRRRFSYANVVATLALFFAMTGGALAASHYLITSTKQIKPSVLSALKGKAGAAGANGVNGANGAAGSQGPQGPAGGSGAAGESVSSAALKSGEGGCATGGSKFTVGGKETAACNGKSGAAGEPGPEGSPWTAGGKLPPEKTETGTWAFGNVPIPAGGEVNEKVSISFTIALKEALKSTHFVTKTEVSEKMAPKECPGSVEAPKAEPGSLCVYEGQLSGEPSFIGITPPAGLSLGTGTTGAVIAATLIPGIATASEAFGIGSWAVTAPPEEP
jgi:hypothetical protein